RSRPRRSPMSICARDPLRQRKPLQLLLRVPASVRDGYLTHDPPAPPTEVQDMIHRSEAWLQAVRSIGACVLCGRPGVQAAHRNELKGMGIKADDSATAALCPDCHRHIDQGSVYPLDQRRAIMDRAIVLTVIEL